MDGLKLYLEKPDDEDIQNIYYNGWKCDHYVTNVLAFAPDGTVPLCCLNVPGNVHDSQVAEWGNIYNKLEIAYNTCGGKCAVDSAFSRLRFPFLVKSSPTTVQGRTNREYLQEEMIREDATALRQSAEWGMRCVESSFPRLKDRFQYEETGERRLVLKSCILLHNVRARLVGINQIRNVYMPHLQVDANERFVRPLRMALVD
jgi:hypothetical protein